MREFEKKKAEFRSIFTIRTTNCLLNAGIEGLRQLIYAFESGELVWKTKPPSGSSANSGGVFYKGNKVPSFGKISWNEVIRAIKDNKIWSKIIPTENLTKAKALYEIFGSNNEPRSDAYKCGARAVITNLCASIEQTHPYKPGTAEFDAFEAGAAEGRRIYNNHKAKEHGKSKKGEGVS